MVEKINAWRDFRGGSWQDSINVRDFIQRNYRPYDGDEGFLAGIAPWTGKLLARYNELLRQEAANGGVLDIDTSTISSLLTYPACYLDRDSELIVGFQTGRPLQRGLNPIGGLKMAREACQAYGRRLDPMVETIFSYRSTHNEGVFRVYTEEMRRARKSGVITGLPDAYGRGRIIGDYRRVPLYGADFLIEQKLKDRAELGEGEMTDDVIRLAEELWKQADFLQKLKEMAWLYEVDISAPARNAREAFQWLYFAYLGAIKEQNGAAMSLGRVSTFLDIYIQRDIDEGLLDESSAQELVDQFVLKLRMSRQLRTSEYNELFAGDPTWITEAVGGVGQDGRPLVTRSSFRFLHTLYTLGPAPEPNLTVLWSPKLPRPFRRYCARVSVETAAIQYENDELMRPGFGDDYGIACCVSAMKLGKQMQYFGARCNLPKVLLMALNGGRDELTGEQVGPQTPLVGDGVLDYRDVCRRYEFYRDWLCRLYVNTMNVIHYMHDKYCYEKLEMALHDSDVERMMAFGLAGLSVVADSFSAIKYARVRPIRNGNGLIREFRVEGDFPCFGNDDDRVDVIAVDLVEQFHHSLERNRTYRGARHTLSVLTITSNVVYGQLTGATPDGRAAGAPFAPGANPMHGRDRLGALASLNSVAKLPYASCLDGISCTFSISPGAIGATENERLENLTAILDGYFAQGGHHLNVNVLTREKLIDAKKHPERHGQLTIRVSGYAVNFNKLSPQQQDEVIARTVHDRP